MVTCARCGMHQGYEIWSRSQRQRDDLKEFENGRQFFQRHPALQPSFPHGSLKDASIDNALQSATNAQDKKCELIPADCANQDAFKDIYLCDSDEAWGKSGPNERRRTEFEEGIEGRFRLISTLISGVLLAISIAANDHL
jgi:hypothetical protein